MAPRTRSKPGASAVDSTTDEEAAKTLAPSDPNPPKLCILPKDTSPNARILTLSNPATASPNRYFFCPEKGIYEFTKLAAPRGTPRSWLISGKRRSGSKPSPRGNEDEDKEADDTDQTTGDDPGNERSSLQSGYITTHADLLIATPLDPLFLILPALAPSTSKEKQMFLSIDDHLDNMAVKPYDLQHVLQPSRFKNILESRMVSICDTVDAGEEKMYRLSLAKLANELLTKAERMVQKGLPASLEDQFISRALQAPIMSIKREVPATVQPGAENIMPSPDDSPSSLETAAESQNSTESQESVVTAATSVEDGPPNDAESFPKSAAVVPDGVPQLLRIRTALQFISSSYLPPTLRANVDKAIESSDRISFAPLDKHVAYLDSLRKEAQALRSLSDNISRKRVIDEDEDAVAERAEKKRKKEEEELKKKNESRGVKALKKVDTKGMKKLSSFFAMKAQGKKA